VFGTLAAEMLSVSLQRGQSGCSRAVQLRLPGCCPVRADRRALLVSGSVLDIAFVSSTGSLGNQASHFFPSHLDVNYFFVAKVTGIMGRAWNEGHRKHGKGRIKLYFHLFRNGYF